MSKVSFLVLDNASTCQKMLLATDTVSLKDFVQSIFKLVGREEIFRQVRGIPNGYLSYINFLHVSHLEMREKYKLKAPLRI